MADAAQAHGRRLRRWPHGPFVDGTNRRWLKEEIDSCWEAVLDEQEDLERRAEETSRRIDRVHDERKDLERQLREAP